jgi:hypothetical protein
MQNLAGNYLSSTLPFTLYNDVFLVWGPYATILFHQILFSNVIMD